MVNTPDWLKAMWQDGTQPADTHSCVDSPISEVTGQRLPVINECKNASSRDIPFGDDVDNISAHKACSPPMDANATSTPKPYTVNTIYANTTSAPGTHKVLAKAQNNTKPLNTKSRQVLSKDVPAVQRGQVRPRDVSTMDVSSSRGQMRPRTDFPSDEHRNQNQRRSQVTKAWVVVNFGEAMRREATRSSSPMLSVLPPAPLLKPPAPSQCQKRSRKLLTPSKASTLRRDNHCILPEPPPPPCQLPSPPPVPT